MGTVNQSCSGLGPSQKNNRVLGRQEFKTETSNCKVNTPPPNTPKLGSVIHVGNKKPVSAWKGARETKRVIKEQQ